MKRPTIPTTRIVGGIRTIAPNAIGWAMLSKQYMQKAASLLKRGGVPLTTKNLQDAYCGLHSGMPPCCVLYFVAIWHPIADRVSNLYKRNNWSLKTRTQYEKVLVDVYEWQHAHKSRVGYIWCPACRLSRRRIKVKQCDCYSEEGEPLNRPDWEAYLAKQKKKGATYERTSRST